MKDSPYAFATVGVAAGAAAGVLRDFLVGEPDAIRDFAPVVCSCLAACP